MADKEYPKFEHECDDLKNRLNRQLRRLRSIDPVERNFTKGSKSRYYTTEMAYLLDTIQRGSVFLAPQVIRRGMDLVGDLESYITRIIKERGIKE